ncbi:MAG: hypothetical protein CVV39_04250 [Planctomycetes bacterium HGW-Planctomycetes-1]|nr:MAG: hypothetical protein CVV39_04250 [Planctomycetes bacterium HGW-Planctomycetes-1]
MSEDILEPIRTEISFFMDKSFQFSFVYIGALFAIIAGAKLEIIKEIANIFFDCNVRLVIVLSALILNFAYLMLSSSCLFAMVKRAYFILNTNTNNSVVKNWEIFTRKSKNGFGIIRWNIDNYFFVVILLVALTSSIVLFCIGFNGSNYNIKATLICILMFYAFPIWCLIEGQRLNNECHKIIKEIEEKKL